jgi:hypothetical protein
VSEEEPGARKPPQDRNIRGGKWLGPSPFGCAVLAVVVLAVIYRAMNIPPPWSPASHRRSENPKKDDPCDQPEP